MHGIENSVKKLRKCQNEQNHKLHQTYFSRVDVSYTGTDNAAGFSAPALSDTKPMVADGRGVIEGESDTTS